MKLFFKNRIVVDGLEFGLEIVQSMGTTVGSSTLVVESVPAILNFITLTTPVGVSM